MTKDKMYNKELSERAVIIWQDGWGLLRCDGEYDQTITINNPEWSSALTDDHVFYDRIDAEEVAYAFDAEVFMVRHGDDFGVGCSIEDHVVVNKLGYIVVKRLPVGWLHPKETLLTRIKNKLRSWIK